ncbi:MAG: hypothetical protein LKE54_04415 [Prevotella sp.]|jgi:hypothetical protein|nr:hypothetical protein [Prevotella sp.]MCH3994286.1 hypothetical protein [Prevotella sp.]
MEETATTKALKQVFTQIRDESRMYANTASRIGNAFLSLLSYLVDAPYLRKDQEDTDQYLLRLLKGCVIGESDSIKLNPDGSIVCDSVKVNGAAVFDELVFNHQNILEGDTYFTDKGIIESVTHTDINQYTLKFRQEYEDEKITFHVNDILLGKINKLDSSRSYYSFFLRIDSIDLTSNTAVCSAYDDADCPGGKNYAPVARARVIRWGNTVDTSRQSVWYVSSNDGRWLFLQGINKPKIEDSEHGSNYAGFIGLPPNIAAVQKLLDNKIITRDQPYLYFRGIMVQDLIRLDYLGNPVYTPREWKYWDKKQKYIKGYDVIEKGYFEDRLWYGGCLWACSVDSCINSEPRFNNPDWTCLIGGGNMSLQILSSKGDAFRAGTDWTADLEATLYNAEMEIREDEIGIDNITWSRVSDDKDGDTVWNIQHPAGSVGMTLPIDSTKDIPSGWGPGSSVGFRCTINLPDGTPVENSYTIND